MQRRAARAGRSPREIRGRIRSPTPPDHRRARARAETVALAHLYVSQPPSRRGEGRWVAVGPETEPEQGKEKVKIKEDKRYTRNRRYTLRGEKTERESGERGEAGRAPAPGRGTDT